MSVFISLYSYGFLLSINFISKAENKIKIKKADFCSALPFSSRFFVCSPPIPIWQRLGAALRLALTRAWRSLGRWHLRVPGGWALPLKLGAPALLRACPGISGLWTADRVTEGRPASTKIRSDHWRAARLPLGNRGVGRSGFRWFPTARTPTTGRGPPRRHGRYPTPLTPHPTRCRVCSSPARPPESQ